MNGRIAGEQVALVTGANKGSGRAAAEALADLGMTVLVGARDPRRGEEAAAALRAGGGDAHALVLDVTDRGHVGPVADIWAAFREANRDDGTRPVEEPARARPSSAG